jgi:hypothetical protein
MEPASATAYGPPSSRGKHEASELSRGVLDQLGGALRAFHESQPDSQALSPFQGYLSALDRVEYVHRKGVEAVSRALEEADANAELESSKQMGVNAPLWRPSKEADR